VTVRVVALLPVTIFPVLFPAKTTLVALRFLPVKVMFCPTLALLVKSFTTAAWKMNLLLVTVPPALVAETVEPDTTLAGTVTSTEPAFNTVNGALTPPIEMFVADPRLVPFRVKVDPTSLTSELVKEMVGRDVLDVLLLNEAVAVVDPAEVVTRKLPLCAPLGDRTVSLVPVGLTATTVTGVLTAAVLLVAGVNRVTVVPKASPRLVPTMSIA
jgi:hypothetical protein